jgi:hypothetical protein
VRFLSLEEPKGFNSRLEYAAIGTAKDQGPRDPDLAFNNFRDLKSDLRLAKDKIEI